MERDAVTLPQDCLTEHQKAFLAVLSRKRKPAPVEAILRQTNTTLEDAAFLQAQGFVHISDGSARKIGDAVSRMVRVRTDWEGGAFSKNRNVSIASFAKPEKFRKRSFVIIRA